MSRTCDEALERLLGSDRVLFPVPTADERTCARLLAEVLPGHVPAEAAATLARELDAPTVVSDRWLRLWFLSWRLGP